MSYEGVVFRKDPQGCLVVSSYSEYVHPENATPTEAVSKIARSKEILAELEEMSPEFSAVASSLRHPYDFCYDYGDGATLLAWMENDQLQWRGLD